MKQATGRSSTFWTRHYNSIGNNRNGERGRENKVVKGSLSPPLPPTHTHQL